MTVEELYAYVPRFDPQRDPQAGDWVLVTPARRVALVQPLIAALEAPASSADAHRTTTPSARQARVRRLPLAAFAQSATLPSGSSSGSSSNGSIRVVEMHAARYADATTMGAHNVALAPLSRAYAVFASDAGSRLTGGVHGGGGSNDSSNAVTRVLYLHVRLALLTPTPPCVFGGNRHDIVLALLQRRQQPLCGDGNEDVYVAPLSLHTGCVADKQTLSMLLTSPSLRSSTPRWAAAVEAAARADWASWQAREQLQRH